MDKRKVSTINNAGVSGCVHRNNKFWPLPNNYSQKFIPVLHKIQTQKFLKVILV